MRIKPIYKENENININSYLNKHGIDDIEEFVKPKGKYIEDVKNYNNMDKGIEMIKGILVT